MHHYTECGLDNVWLANGYTVHNTPYGKGVSVDHADDLLAALARWLTLKPGRLTGKELRFLRTFLTLSQASLARMTGATEQSVSLWERTGKVPMASDALVRMLVLEKLEGDSTVSQVIERINRVERLVHQSLVLRSRQHRWTVKAQAPYPAEDEALA